MQEKRGRITLLLLGLALAGLVFWLHGRVFFRYTVDDAFISFRFGKNLAEGQGLVYNPGERVEGYSNLSWTLLFALVSLASGEPVLTIKLIGLGVGLLALGAAAWLALEVCGTVGAALACAGLLALNPFVAVWGVAGLESPLMMLAVTLLALGAARENKPLYAAAGALAILTHPEGTVLVLAVAGSRAWRRRGLELWPLAPLLASVGQLAFRVAYYGDWVPNTAHVKLGGGWPQYVQGAQYLFQFFDDWNGLLGLLALCVAPFLLELSAGVLACLAVAFAELAFLLYSGGDYFAMYRLVVPVLPVLTALLVATARAAGARLGLRPPGAALAVGVLGLGLASAPILKGEPGRTRLQSEINTMDGFQRPAARWLREHSPPGSTIALTVAGAIPYLSGLRSIDRLGLCDREIALAEVPWADRHYGIAKFDSRSVLRRKPDWILLNLGEDVARRHPAAELYKHAYLAADRDLLRQVAFHQEYRLVKGWLGNASAQAFALYVRRGSSAEAALPPSS